MTNKPQRLNDILGLYAPGGANDVRWFLVEHQLEQVAMSARAVVGALKVIEGRPENEEEREVARDCVNICESLLVEALGTKASLLSYLSGTDIPERISQKGA